GAKMSMGPAVDPGANITKVLSAKSLSPQLPAESSFHKRRSGQFLEGAPPAVGHLFAAGELVIRKGTRHQVMALETRFLFCPVRNVHPPAIAHIALVEHQFLVVTPDRDPEPCEPFAIEPGQIVGAAAETVQE